MHSPACVHACVCVSVRATRPFGHPCGAAGTGSIYTSAQRAGWPPGVLAAGVTWASRTPTALWAARRYHTSVVDAVSGAIYVLGGYGIGNTFPHDYNDVWASTDGGARAGLGRGGGRRGTLGRYYRGYSRVL